MSNGTPRYLRYLLYAERENSGASERNLHRISSNVCDALVIREHPKVAGMRARIRACIMYAPASCKLRNYDLIAYSTFLFLIARKLRRCTLHATPRCVFLFSTYLWRASNLCTRRLHNMQVLRAPTSIQITCACVRARAFNPDKQKQNPPRHSAGRCGAHNGATQQR